MASTNDKASQPAKQNQDGDDTEVEPIPGSSVSAAAPNLSQLSVEGWENFIQGFVNVMGKNKLESSKPNKRSKDHDISSSEDESSDTQPNKKSKNADSSLSKQDLVKEIVTHTVQAMSGKNEKQKTPKKSFDTTALGEGPYKAFMEKQKSKLEEKKRQGPPLEANLAAYLENTFDEAATGALKGEDMKALIKKYPTPSNLLRLVAPEVDDIVKNIVKDKAKNEYPSIRGKCDHIKYLQRDLVAAASALTQLATFMANQSAEPDLDQNNDDEDDKKVSLNGFVEHINEALHILVFVIQKMNEDRQALWAKHISPDTVEALKANAAKGENPSMLYGGELVEVSKQVDAGRKTVTNSAVRPKQQTTPQKQQASKQTDALKGKQQKKPYFKNKNKPTFNKGGATGQGQPINTGQAQQTSGQDKSGHKQQGFHK